MSRVPRALWIVLLVALGLRVAVVLQYEAGHPLAERPVIDEESYETWAREIASGDWLGDEVFFQEPLYPYWLGSVYALFGSDRTTARLLQALLGAVAAGLTWAVTRRVFGERAALWAGLGMALHRPALLFPALLLKPNLVLPVLALLALVLLGRRGEATARTWLVAGLIGGLGALLRGNVLILLPWLVLWPVGRALLERRRAATGLPGAAAVLAGIALVLVPVTLRNLAVGGELTLTTSGAGTNLYGGNNLDNPTGRATEFDWVRGIPEHEADDWRHEAERRLGRALEPGEVSRYWMGETLRSMRAHPGAHLRILWNKLRLTLGAYEVPDNHHLDWDARHVALLRWPLPGWGVSGLLGLAGVALVLVGRRSGAAAPRDPGAALELAVLFGLYVATIVLTVTSMRARLALVPLLLPFAGYAVEVLLRGPGARPRLVCGAALALAAPLALVPVFDAAEREADLAKREFNQVTYLLDDSGGREVDLELAERRLRELAAAYPGTSRIRTLLADVALRRAQTELHEGAGDRELALAHLGEALDLLRSVVENPRTNPRERFRANVVAAHIQIELGRWEVAERRLRDAREFDPRDRGLQLVLADVLRARAGLEETDEDTRAALEGEVRELLEALLPEQDGEGVRARLDALDARD